MEFRIILHSSLSTGFEGQQETESVEFRNLLFPSILLSFFKRRGGLRAPPAPPSRKACPSEEACTKVSQVNANSDSSLNSNKKKHLAVEAFQGEVRNSKLQKRWFQKALKASKVKAKSFEGFEGKNEREASKASKVKTKV